MWGRGWGQGYSIGLGAAAGAACGQGQQPPAAGGPARQQRAASTTAADVHDEISWEDSRKALPEYVAHSPSEAFLVADRACFSLLQGDGCVTLATVAARSRYGPAPPRWNGDLLKIGVRGIAITLANAVLIRYGMQSTNTYKA
nr:hypothetical protein Iba_chr13fCG3440 [Ipomoea batatas]